MADEWEPIETAPRNGTVIIVADLTDKYPYAQVVCWWPERDEDYPWTIFEGDNGSDGLNARDKRFPYTHWMPLPKAPKPTPNKETNPHG